ncbi:MAG: phage tail tape measure protein [Pseudolabrys sp.]|nr:phage tail tape measure protein [Pseudolabrys sp.]
MAASASGVRAGKAYVELGVDSKIQAGLNAARAKLVSFGRSLSIVGVGAQAVGAAITGPFLAAAKQFADMGSAIYDVSQRTGVSAEAFSQLSFVAEQAGGSAEGLEKAFRKLAVVTTDAASGSTSAQAALEAVGVSVADLAGLNPEDQFERIADGIAGIDDPSQRAAASLKIFGRGGAELLPVMARGAAGIRAARAEAEALGITMSGTDAEAADRLGDSWSVLSTQLKYLTAQFGASIAPILSVVAERASRVVAAFISFAKANREILATVFTVGAGIVLFGSVLLGLGVTIASVGLVLGFIATAIGAIGTVAVAAAAAIGTAFAAIASPIGIAVIASLVLLGSLISIVEYTTGAFSTAIDYLSGKFNELWTTVKETFGGISDALLASDLTLAAEILWAGIKLAFANGARDVVVGFFDLVASLQSAWTSVTGRMSQAFAVFIGSVQIGVAQVKQTLLELAADLTVGRDSLAGQILISGGKAELNSAVAQFQAEMAGSVAGAESKLQADLAKIEAARVAKVGVTDTIVAGLQSQLDALVSKAKEAREERDQLKRDEEKKASKKPIAAASASKTLRESTIGTFNGSRLNGLGGSVFARIENATKKIADDVAGILREVEDMDGAEFGD